MQPIRRPRTWHWSRYKGICPRTLQCPVPAFLKNWCKRGRHSPCICFLPQQQLSLEWNEITGRGYSLELRKVPHKFEWISHALLWTFEKSSIFGQLDRSYALSEWVYWLFHTVLTDGKMYVFKSDLRKIEGWSLKSVTLWKRSSLISLSWQTVLEDMH